MKIKLLSALLAALMLSSCGILRYDSDSTAPATRAPSESTVPHSEGETTDGATESTAQPSTEATTDAVATPSGKPALVIPSDLSFLDSISRAHFGDKNPDDPNGCWYPGRFVRDLTTGEVTTKWDRDAATLALVDKYGAIYRGDETKKYVYLTFDCGYEYVTDEFPNGVTSSILDTLKEKGVKGTFFVTGDYLKGTQGEKDIVRRMLDEGHIVGSHTYSHYNMTTLTPEQFVDEIKKNNDLFRSLFPDAPDMTFYRPPEGGANEWTLALAQAMGLTTCFWSATEADYNTSAQPDPATTLLNDKTKLHNGGVYLLHAVSTTNATILGELIDYIIAEGYEIRPLDEFVR